MAQNKKKKKQKDSQNGKEIAGVILITIGIIFGLAIFTSTEAPVIAFCGDLAFGLFGVAGYVFPFALIALGVFLIASRKLRMRLLHKILFIIGIISLFVIIHIGFESHFSTETFGRFVTEGYNLGIEKVVGAGAFAAVFAYYPLILMGKVGGIILGAALLLICIMVITNLSIKKVSGDIYKAGHAAYAAAADKNAVRREKARIAAEERAEEKRKRKERKLFDGISKRMTRMNLQNPQRYPQLSLILTIKTIYRLLQTKIRKQVTVFLKSTRNTVLQKNRGSLLIKTAAFSVRKTV